MTQAHIPTATDRFEGNDCQVYSMSQMANFTDSGMWPYTELGHPEHDVLQYLSRSSHNPAFTHEPAFTDTFIQGGTVVTTPAQPPIHLTHLTHLTHHEFPNSGAASHFLPQSRLSMQAFQPPFGTLERQTMMSPSTHYSISQTICHGANYDPPAPAYLPDLVPSTTTSPSLSFSPSPEQYYPHPDWPSSMSATGMEDGMSSIGDGFDEEKEGSLNDKPYAQLIYEALMQAPGHRMLLRDIYDWFRDNTKKAEESGSNGWQNSIRHNLSMNHAFENDKSDPAANRGARKANSVWVLTEHAIRNGVQSTTRYRKHNPCKKGMGSKAPAIQRQRSGARGGRAARRAKLLKRSEGSGRKAPTSQPSPRNSVRFGLVDEMMPARHEQWSKYSVCSPATPDTDGFLSPSFGMPVHSQYEAVENGGIKYEVDPFLDEDDQLCQMFTPRNSHSAFGDVANF